MKTPAVMLSIATLLSGCMVLVPVTGHLYPIQGPLASQAPLPIFPVALRGAWSGTLSTTFQGGEVCKGRWSQIRQDDPSANKMATQWDAVYGQGFFVAHVLGKPFFARGTLTCAQGTTVNVQFYNPEQGNVTALTGTAQDSKGNLYKLTF